MFVLILCAFASGCVDPIEFESDRTGGHLVVDGRITDDSGPHELRLGRTFDQHTVPRPVRGALVTITDGDGTSENYVETQPGLYLLAGDVVRGERGQTYSIEIRTPDGRHYRSIPEVMPDVIASDSVYVELGTVGVPSESGIIIDRPAVNVFLDSRIPEHAGPVYLKWDLEQVYGFREEDRGSPFPPFPKTCFITEQQNPQRILLLNSSQSNSISISKQLVARIRVIPFQYYSRHYFNVSISSMTERAYNYWTRVDQVINSTGTIFDVPPANVPGNIYNIEDGNEQVLGYFSAAIVDTSRARVIRSDLGFHIPDPCSFSNPNRHFACRECLLIENSTTDRPSYF